MYMRLSKGDRALCEKGGCEEGGREEVSREEGSREESNSIRMQRKLLKEYVELHFRDYELLEFEDDGYSGTSFDRPGVTRLLEMVRNMEIDCVIVKDFSRFSRDYIELGSYMEQIFPFMGVRFISVNDGYDSAEGRYAAGELDISFRNLLYDLYSKDLSVKVKSALAVRKERGQYISAHSPFGYRKSRENRHMLVIAEDEAEVVRRIFALTLQGRSSTEIAELFNRAGVKTPMQFRREKGETGRVPKKGIFVWQSSTVCQILRNQVYTGDIAYGKTEKETVGGKNRLKPRSEWKLYPGHHEPIIDRHTFQRLQEGRGAGKRKPGDARHPLTGKLVCGCCGRNLRLRKTAEPCFVCPYRYTGSPEKCVERARAVYLERYVLSELQRHILQMEGEENLRDRCREIAGKKREECKRKRRQLQREEALLRRQKAEAYETYPAGDKDGCDGQAAQGKPAGREEFLKTRLAELEKKIMTIKVKLAENESETAFLDRIIRREQETAEAMDFLGLAELTGRNVSGLIDKIVVYGGKENGIKIEIHWIEWERVTLFWQLCDTGGN